MTDVPAGSASAGGPWPAPAHPVITTPGTDWLTRFWPGPSPSHASPGVLAAAAVAGLLGAWVLVTERVGVNVPLTGLAIAACTVPAMRRRLTVTSITFGALAVALLAVVVVRDAPWLAALCVMLAVPLASFALVGGRGWTEVMLGGLTAPFAGMRMLPWSGRGLSRLRSGLVTRLWPLVRALVVSVTVVVVFGALLVSSDAVFGDLAERLLPDLDLGLLPLRGVLFAVTAGFALALAYTASAPPRLGTLTSKGATPARRLEWLLPLLALDGLLLAFVLVQAAVLVSSDREALLRSTGLTYAEYARQGFAQLVVVTGLVLAVLAVAVRKAPRESRRDRVVERLVLGMLCALALLVVVVALRRLGLYEQAYGFTRLRLWVHAFELWLGLVIVLVAAAGVRLWTGWLPRTVAASGALGLLLLAAVDPDALVARHNVERFEATGRIDASYLSGLSADAVPVLDDLPDPYRSRVLGPIAARIAGPEPWYAANLGRARGRAILERSPGVDERVCPASAVGHQNGIADGSVD